MVQPTQVVAGGPVQTIGLTQLVFCGRPSMVGTPAAQVSTVQALLSFGTSPSSALGLAA
jgi:hypothetical protein